MPPQDVARLRNHWWPRPGWRPGRIIYTWHLTFQDTHDLHRLVANYHRQLDQLPGLNPVPLEWLHLTIQGVGYTDEVSDDQLDAVIVAVRAEVATLSTFDLTFDRPVILGEAIAIRPEPDDPLQHLRTAIRHRQRHRPGAGPWVSPAPDDRLQQRRDRRCALRHRVSWYRPAARHRAHHRRHPHTPGPPARPTLALPLDHRSHSATHRTSGPCVVDPTLTIACVDSQAPSPRVQTFLP